MKKEARWRRENEIAVLEANLNDTATLPPNSSYITALDSTQCRTHSCLISGRSLCERSLDLRDTKCVRPSKGMRRREQWLVFIDLKIATLCQKLRLESALQSPSLPGGSERLPLSCGPFCRPGPRPRLPFLPQPGPWLCKVHSGGSTESKSSAVDDSNRLGGASRPHSTPPGKRQRYRGGGLSKIL